jgi:hypothetical protein
MLVSTVKEKLIDIASELQAQTDRGAAIIGAAIVDDFLTDALKNRLILTAEVAGRLFSYEANGPLAAFSAKINIAFAVGLIEGKQRADLHDIRRIRNRFAHIPEPLGFSDEQVVRWCSRLRTVDDQTRALPLRAQYLGVCGGTSAYFAALSHPSAKLQSVRSVPGLLEEVQRAVDEMVKLIRNRHDPSRGS